MYTASPPSPTTSPPPDPCLVATTPRTLIDYDTAKACLDADFPFPADNRAKTVATVKTVIRSSFVFEDLAENPPSVPGLSLKPAPLVKDLDALLGMHSNAIQTYRQFHEGIADILIKAHDAHLEYTVECFRQFLFEHGFLMADMIDNTGNRVIKVVAVLRSWRNLTSLQFSPGDCNVVQINDQPAHDFIQTWADSSVDISKDAAIRWVSIKDDCSSSLHQWF